MDNVFDLPAEYKELRTSVRALAEKEIAPFAQAVDEEHRFPSEAKAALVKNGLFAAHVPTEFGGDGADALAAVIIIEEVARVCGSSSLIPAVNKLLNALATDGFLTEVRSGSPMRVNPSFIQ